MKMKCKQGMCLYLDIDIYWEMFWQVVSQEIIKIFVEYVVQVFELVIQSCGQILDFFWLSLI